MPEPSDLDVQLEGRVLRCGDCGANVYRNHLDTGVAGFVSGRLLCVHCYKQRRDASDTLPEYAESQPDLTNGRLDSLLEDPEESIDTKAPEQPEQGTILEEYGPAATHTPVRPRTKAQALSGSRTFHAVLTDDGLRQLDQRIGEWCKRHPDLKIKSSTSAVAPFPNEDGQPSLIVTVFY